MQVTTYLAIAGGCALFYLLSMLSGGHHDPNHDFGGSHEGHSQDGHEEGENPLKAFLSVRSILLLGLGYGAIGAIGSVLGLAFVLIQILGVGSGLFFAWLRIKLFRFLYNQDATTSNNLFELEGMSGRILTAIPQAGVGEVIIRPPRGEVQYLRARSDNGQPIAADQNVEVVSVAAGDLVVRSTQTLPPVLG